MVSVRTRKTPIVAQVDLKLASLSICILNNHVSCFFFGSYDLLINVTNPNLIELCVWCIKTLAKLEP